jgi:catechol 2,3-dioxygenase-like lactoylglutathione lyase family enzyme
MTQISPLSAVGDANAGIAFYQKALGAELSWHLDGAVAGLAVDAAKFFLAPEEPA